MSKDPVQIARAVYDAYVRKDRKAIESLIADDFHFTSPLDNRLDRSTYFARCWPNSETTANFEFRNLVSDGGRVFVTYELTNTMRSVPQYRILRREMARFQMWRSIWVDDSSRGATGVSSIACLTPYPPLRGSRWCHCFGCT